MNTASISALHHLVSQVVGRKTQEDVSGDAFSVPVTSASPIPAVDAVSENTSNSNNDASFDEAFAKLLVSLKASTQQSSDESAFTPLPVDTSIAARDSAVSKDDGLDVATAEPVSSARQEFMDYMKLSPADKMREKLTGVSKEEYDAMTPEEKLSVDQKVQVAVKEQQEAATADVKSKILAARLALV